MKNLSWTLGREEQGKSSMRRYLYLQLWPGSPWQQRFCRTMEDECCPPYVMNFFLISFWQRKVVSSTHEYFSVSEPDSCEKSLSFFLQILRMVMVLQRSNLKCLLLKGKNFLMPLLKGIQVSGREGFRCFGFLFFSHLSLARFWAGGDSVGHPLVNADPWKMLCPWRKVTKRHCCCSSKGSNTSHMSQLLLWETFRFSDNFSFLHKKTPNK